MPITASDFDQLCDELQEVFNETKKSKIAESVGLTVFDVMDTNLLTYEYQNVHGVKVIEEVADGQDLPVASTNEGDIIAFNKFFLNIRKAYNIWQYIMVTRSKLIFLKIIAAAENKRKNIVLAYIMKRCSELYGNIKSIAEMTMPSKIF